MCQLRSVVRIVVLIRISLNLGKRQRHFPGQALSRNDYKWDHLAILKDMSCSWQRGQENAIAGRAQVKQGENDYGEQGRVTKCQT